VNSALQRARKAFDHRVPATAQQVAGRIVEIAGFLDPGVHRYVGLPAELSHAGGTHQKRGR
jgi:hypothetical protein